MFWTIISELFSATEKSYDYEDEDDEEEEEPEKKPLAETTVESADAKIKSESVPTRSRSRSKQRSLRRTRSRSPSRAEPRYGYYDHHDRFDYDRGHHSSYSRDYYNRPSQYRPHDYRPRYSADQSYYDRSYRQTGSHSRSRSPPRSVQYQPPNEVIAPEVLFKAHTLLRGAMAQLAELSAILAPFGKNEWLSVQDFNFSTKKIQNNMTKKYYFQFIK